jgi:peptide/nickel transport system substrate-binding protein
MLKKGEVDIAYLLDAPLAEEVKRDPKLKLAFSGGIGNFFLDYFDQWDPKSPWHDKRVRLAANYAIDRVALSEAETLGASKPTGSIIPTTFEFALPIEPYPYDPARAKQLLAEAGYPNGFDAGELHQVPPYFSMGEAIINYLGAQTAYHGTRCLFHRLEVETTAWPVRVCRGPVWERRLTDIGSRAQ